MPHEQLLYAAKYQSECKTFLSLVVFMCEMCWLPHIYILTDVYTH